MNRKKNLLALILALVMLVSALPLSAFGAEAEEPIPEQQSLTAEEETGEAPAEEAFEEAAEPEDAPETAPETPEDEVPAAEPEIAAKEELAAEPEIAEEKAPEPEPAEGSETVYYIQEPAHINPLYRDVLDESDLVRDTPQTTGRRRMARTALAGEPDYVASMEEAAGVIRAGLKQRAAVITLYFSADQSSDGSLKYSIFLRALEHTGKPTEGDYLKWQYGGYAKNQDTYRISGDRYLYTFTYVMTYYTTGAEEQQVDSRVAGLRQELGLPGKSTYEKVETIYDYVTDSVTYDHDYQEKEDAENYHPWTTYGALVDHTAVCQGYATLVYRLMLEEGIDCRVISGYASTGEYHAWNIVKLGNRYYNLDATWDAGKNTFEWFLKSDENFVDHSRDDDAFRGNDFTSEAFYAVYPMSKWDFVDQTALLDTPVLTDAESTGQGVKLTWAPVDGALWYRVWLKNANGGWGRVGDTDETSFTAYGVKAGEEYIFTVSCIDDAGRERSDKDPDGIRVLYAPVYLPAPELNQPANVYGGVKVSWKAVEDGNRYRVFYRTKGTGWTQWGDVNGTSAILKGLTSGTRYDFTVCCVSDNGSYLTSGYDETGRTITYVAAPEIHTISAANGKVSLKWNPVAGAVKYRVFYKTGRGTWQQAGDTNATGYTTKALPTGKTYTFTVRCISENGANISSYNAAGKNVLNLATPQITKIQAGNGKVSVTWGKVAGAAKYRVFYKTGSGSWQEAGDTAGTSLTTKALSKGKKYTFTVRCISADGRSYTSTYHAAGRTVSNLDTPVVKKVTAGTRQATVSWGKVSGGEKYRVFYRLGSGSWQKAGDTTGTSFKVTKLQKGKTYSFTVRCISKDGKSYTSAYHATGVRAKIK